MVSLFFVSVTVDTGDWSWQRLVFNSAFLQCVILASCWSWSNCLIYLLSSSFVSGILLLFTLEKPSNDESHPDYIPSVLPTKKTYKFTTNSQRTNSNSQRTNSQKIDKYNAAKRHALSNLENFSKIVMLTNINDRSSDIKQEPVFIGPKNTAVQAR